MADIVKTIGSSGDYADPILWAAGEGGAYTTDRAVGELIENVSMSSLFRPNQAFAGGGLLRGDTEVTGKSGDGRSLANTAGTRICLAPNSSLDFQDIEFTKGSNTYTIQNSGNNTLTRCLMPEGFIYYTADKSLTLNNCVIAKLDGLSSATQGNLALSNTTVTDRIITRAETLLTIVNSNSIANDWLLGRGTYTNSETLVNYCYIKQNAPASDFGTGSSNNTINTDTTAEMVDYAGGDYRTKSTSTLATAGQGGTFIGAFLEASSGLTVTGATANFDYSSISGGVDLTVEILVSGATAGYGFSAIVGNVDLTGAIDVSGQTAGFNYSAVSGSIDLTGSIDIVGQVSSFSYSAINGAVDLTGEVIVTGLTANFNYQTVTGNIELTTSIDVSGSTANYNYNGINGSVALVGDIGITGSTVNYSYSGVKGFVQIGDRTDYSDISVGFAQDQFSVKYKQNTITVNYK